jgi:hypothetical protein
MNKKEIFFSIFITFFSNFSFAVDTSSVIIEMPQTILNPAKMKLMKDYTAIVAITYGRDESSCSKTRHFGHAALIYKTPNTYSKSHIILEKSPKLVTLESRIESSKKYLDENDVGDEIRMPIERQINQDTLDMTSIIERNKEANYSNKLRAFSHTAPDHETQKTTKDKTNYETLNLESYEEIESIGLTASQCNSMIQKIESVERILNDNPDDQLNAQDIERISEVRKLNCLSFIEYVIPDGFFKLKSRSRAPLFEQEFRDYEQKKTQSSLKHYSYKSADWVLGIC